MWYQYTRSDSTNGTTGKPTARYVLERECAFEWFERSCWRSYAIHTILRKYLICRKHIHTPERDHIAFSFFLFMPIMLKIWHRNKYNKLSAGGVVVLDVGPREVLCWFDGSQPKWYAERVVQVWWHIIAYVGIVYRHRIKKKHKHKTRFLYR